MSNEEETKSPDGLQAITGAGAVAANYAAAVSDDLETRAGGVAFNYAAPVEPVEATPVVVPPEAPSEVPPNNE